MSNSDILTKELQKSMHIFMREKTYTEIRILKTDRGTISGYYNDLDRMITAIKKYDGKYNIFFTMNEPMKGVETRSINHMKYYSQNTTTDSEIARRRWILIDLDPSRPSGISSTDEELKYAEILSVKIKEFLSEKGFTEPVTALSGNGYHLLYPVDMPNDKESTQLVRDFLNVLDKGFSTDKVKVDTANYNAARITKLYGTIACKGDNTEDRPHRRSRIITIPEKIAEVSADMIKAITQKEQTMENATGKNNPKINAGKNSNLNNGFSLDKWLDKHGIMVARKKSVENGNCYVLEECPWNHEHSRDQGAYIIQYNNGRIVAGCHHDSCKGQGVSWESLWKIKEGDKFKMDEKDSKKNIGKNGNQHESQADILINKLNELGHEYFHNDKGEAFVQVQEGVYPTNYPLESELYQMLITKIYYDTTLKSIRKDAIRQVLDTLKAKACFDGKSYKTFKRFALFDNKLYYLVADSPNTILCISENGIETCTEPPVRLIKKQYMLEQPMPVQGEALIKLMRKYYHFETKDDEILHDVVLITRLITNIEQPIVIYTGPKGSFKTTSMDMDKRILDYSSINVSLLPKNEEDFLLALNSQDIKCFDNIDNIGKAQADVFCQILSNSSAEKRKKYTDSELCEINIKSTVYMTAINLLSGRTDFLSRCIVINTKAVEGNMRSKTNIMNEFEKDKPYFLYGVFTTLSKAMKVFLGLGDIEINDRLVDFIRWGYAVAEAMGYGGKQFLDAYENNRQRINEEALAEDEVAHAVMLYLTKYESFSGTMTQLSGELIKLMSSNAYTVSGKIKSPIQLSKRLHELESELNTVGIKVDIGKKNGVRYVILTNEAMKEQNKMMQVPLKKPLRKPIRKN